jgi:hypothetical protein
MAHTPVFAGLVIDENDRPAEIKTVGEEAFYVVDDAGFLRHIPSEDVDRQVLEKMREQVEGNEDAITEQTARMVGEMDIFSRAMILNQLKNMDKQFDMILKTGIPEEGRAYLGMMGFRVVINIHGEVIRIDQPAAAPGEGGNSD